MTTPAPLPSGARGWVAGVIAITMVASPAAAAQPSAAPTATPAPAAAAPAAPLGPDEVLLVGGGFVRGTIVELVPDTRVVIVTGAGERREIPWDEVAEVQRDKHRTDDDATVRPVAPVIAPPELPARGRPRIHLELTRPRPVTLFEIDREVVASGYGTSMYGIEFRSVCAAPCDRVVDGSRGQDFFVGTGEAAIWTASRKFTLSEQQGDVTIRVRPGNRAMRIAGAIMLGLGIGGTLAGGLLAIPRSTRTPGIIMLAIGVPALLAGIPMTVLGRTRYELGDRVEAADGAP